MPVPAKAFGSKSTGKRSAVKLDEETKAAQLAPPSITIGATFQARSSLYPKLILSRSAFPPGIYSDFWWFWAVEGRLLRARGLVNYAIYVILLPIIMSQFLSQSTTRELTELTEYIKTSLASAQLLHNTSIYFSYCILTHSAMTAAPVSGVESWRLGGLYPWLSSAIIGMSIGTRSFSRLPSQLVALINVVVNSLLDKQPEWEHVDSWKILEAHEDGLSRRWMCDALDYGRSETSKRRECQIFLRLRRHQASMDTTNEDDKRSSNHFQLNTKR
ncbi:uncharacterized protein BDR25DRAFT_356278 [Lindgomyces ingoldianus]|uniref:Uncharacterized protein n=1 Tax=Lindgomyces ingoldianus TaxID=673940 RepID=A0ACB6QSQ8_9PLEO|nr:uncharacterized protein BDR25DRAFT_356278 [Lindgomyces ingoldianus]KAF2469555.1 hypothetical protein BDR25DRAFT_356278 [Lindgomyces ingoldianus]